jgi:hypothetical protein
MTSHLPSRSPSPTFETLRHDQDARRVLVHDGERLVLPSDHVWLLERGEVLVYRGTRPIELWTAPRSLDAAGSGAASFVAVGQAALLGIERSRVEPAVLARLLGEENATLWARIGLDAQRDDDLFLPWAIPEPGPWWFRRARAVAMVVQGDRRRIAACMPRGVWPLPGSDGRYVLVLVRFEDVGSVNSNDPRRFVYHEVTPFLPAWSGLRGPCAFVPELYPDAWMAAILGREIHGFPKRTARIGLRDDGGELLVDRKLALRVRWRSGAEQQPSAVVAELADALFGSDTVARLVEIAVDHLPDRLGFAALVHKRIGAPQTSGRSFQVDELVRVPVSLDPITRAETLELEVAELGDGPGILHGRILAAWHIESGLRFGPGTRVRTRPGRRDA